MGGRKLLPINIAFLSYENYISEKFYVTLDNLNISWVLLASADLSHRLQQGPRPVILPVVLFLMTW